MIDDTKTVDRVQVVSSFLVPNSNQGLRRTSKSPLHWTGLSKNIKISYEEVDLENVIQEVIATLTLPEHIDISTDFDGALRSVQADGGLVRRVFTNILTSAVQAMPDGGFIIVEGSVVKGVAKVSVSDTGQGISEENLKKIFQPLFTTKVKGAGLGLAVCKRLVEAHRRRDNRRHQGGRGDHLQRDDTPEAWRGEGSGRTRVGD
jgi:signal transduction histidine kinase